MGLRPSDTALQYVAEDAVYALHLAGEEAPVVPETAGRQNIEAAFRQIGDQFEYLAFRPHGFETDGDVTRLRIDQMYRHRASGEMLAGTALIVIRVRDGAVVRADEYHDRPLIEAFLRLFKPS